MKIEVGKYYRTRGGLMACVDSLRVESFGTWYQGAIWTVNGDCHNTHWTLNGTHAYSGNTYADLVEEYVPPVHPHQAMLNSIVDEAMPFEDRCQLVKRVLKTKLEPNPCTEIKMPLFTIGVQRRIDMEDLEKMSEMRKLWHKQLEGASAVRTPIFQETYCRHDWKVYDSGWSRFEYCSICDKRKDQS